MHSVSAEPVLDVRRRTVDDIYPARIGFRNHPRAALGLIGDLQWDL